MAKDGDDNKMVRFSNIIDQRVETIGDKDSESGVEKDSEPEIQFSEASEFNQPHSRMVLDEAFKEIFPKIIRVIIKY